MTTKVLLLAATIGFTVYAQLVLKWQVSKLPPLPPDLGDRIVWGLRFMLRPWLLTCFASGFLAFVSWFLVLREMELSRAYPFLGLSFILVALLSPLFFDESLSAARLVGTVLVVVGLGLASQG